MTGHFINSDWEMKSKVLMTRSSGERQTSANLAEEMEHCFKEFGIDGKVGCVVTDNAKNVSNAAKMIAEHHPCFAHTLNLAVSDALKKDPKTFTLVKKVKSIVNFFNSSALQTSRLKELHIQRGSKFLKLKQECETRWNSTFDMLDRYITQHQEITTVLCTAGKPKMCLGNDEEDGRDEIDMVKEIVLTLKPFKEATTELSAEKFTTISKVLPMIQILKKTVANKTGHTLATQLDESLEQRFSQLENKSHLKIATMLDPRFKRKDALTPGLIQEIKALMNTDNETPNEKNATVEIEADTQETATGSASESSLWDEYDKDNEDDRGEGNGMSAADMELQFYIETRRLDRSSDPLLWWKSHSQTLPLLSRLAKTFLASPATSVPSEQVFSKAGEIINKRRSNLKKSNVDMLIFLNKNLNN